MDNVNRSLGFLLYETSRLMRLKLDQCFKPLGLTQVQWRALARLSRSEGINQVKLADLLEVRPITLARLIDRLEEAQWVERRPDPSDRRACRLFLTSKAQPLLQKMQALAREVREEALDGLPEDARETLINSLCHIKRNLQRGNDEAPDHGTNLTDTRKHYSNMDAQ